MARETKGDQPIKDDETLLFNSELQYNVLQPPFVTLPTEYLV